MEIKTEDKGHVLVHTCKIPSPIEATAVLLDLQHGEEKRYRLRTPEGFEARISTAKISHLQQEKLHTGAGIYILKQGWIAVCTLDEQGKIKVDIGFANVMGHFFVQNPGQQWYVTFLSENVAYTYASSDGNTGEIREESFYKTIKKVGKDGLLELYSNQQSLSLATVMQWVKKSYVD